MSVDVVAARQPAPQHSALGLYGTAARTGTAAVGIALVQAGFSGPSSEMQQGVPHELAS